MEGRVYDSVILDVGAFSKLGELETVGETLYTSCAYLSDARRQAVDPAALQRIQTYIPSSESIDVVKQFAKETGDSEELTELDFILMAIMYDIEKRRVGVNHINRTPLLDRSRYFENTGELREVGVNVCAEPCIYYSFPGGCTRGNACFYRHPGDIDHRPIPPYKERTLRATAPAFVYSGGVVSYPQHDDHSSDEKYIRKDSSNTTRRDRETTHHNEEVNVNTALPPLQKHQGSSHVYGGSGSLVVKGEEEDCADDWVDASSLSSFSKNVPVESNRPVKDHVVCCTGNPAVQRVLLQMGFQLLSMELQPITKLRVGATRLFEREECAEIGHARFVRVVGTGACDACRL
ncbi:hypothetical protein WA538_004970 [Blastocystis sp. DL]